MSTDSGTTLRVHLHASPSKVPAGTPATAVGGAVATVTLGADRTELHVALPRTSVAEDRWILDRLVRNVTSLVKADAYELSADEELGFFGPFPFALDLHNRGKGSFTLVDNPELSDYVARIGALEDGYRSWVDEDPSTRTSVAIARDVAAWAAERTEVEVEVFEEGKLEQLGMRLLLAVGQASVDSPPRLVLAHYRPKDGDNRDKAPLMLLGKGITFDTGGINVKPYDSFVSMMKNDMGGAALAFHLFRGLVEDNFGSPVVLVIPTCENAVGEKAMRPGAIVESYRGHKVRIDHTDAEGRLIMADGLAYGTERFEPAQILTFATLTTSALISYGPFATPVHFAEPAFEGMLARAAGITGVANGP